MSRDLSASNITASQAGNVRPAFFAELDFANGAFRANSTVHDIAFDVGEGSPSSQTFFGVGFMGSVSVIREENSMDPRAIQFTLRGIPRDLISISLNQHYQGRSARYWVGMLDDQHALIDPPQLLFGGLMDTMDTEMGADSQVVVTALDRFSRWDTAPEIRYTDEQQRARFPGDKGLEFISQVPEKEIFLNVKL